MFWSLTMLCNAATELFIVWAVASSSHYLNCQKNEARTCLIFLSEFTVFENMDVVILFALIAHYTPTSVSCNGISYISLGI